MNVLATEVIAMRFLIKLIPWVIVVLAIFFLGAHTFGWSLVTVDTTTITLLALLLVIPVSQYIKRIRFGDFEAEIDPQEVASIKAKTEAAIDTSPDEETIRKVTSVADEIFDLVEQDPQLGLTKLRIELERALRSFLFLGCSRTTKT